MKRFLFIAFVFFVSCNFSKSSGEKAAVNPEVNFDWLLGNWERTNEKEGRATYENWVKMSSNVYDGTGFTLQQSDTVWSENIQLIKIKGGWSFNVVGRGDSIPTQFKLIYISDGSFTCENKQNEFPKKIIYTLEGNEIKAVISSGDMEIPCDFKRK